MAGCIAGVLNQEAEIFEAGDGTTQHQAVLRFRSPAVGEAVGIPFNKVKVYKDIVLEGKFVNSSINLMNSYSHKVTGTYMDRSIANLETEERWIAPEGFHDMLKIMCEGRIFYNKEIKARSDLNDYVGSIISTVPIGILAKILGMDVLTPTQFNHIYVTKLGVSDCDLQQTLYFPGRETTVYRATMTGDKMRIESMLEIKTKDVKYISECFGIEFNPKSLALLSNHLQPIGKLLPMNEAVRREFINVVTAKSGIYSLGRFATWRNILLDDVLRDIHQIRKMINQDQYSNRLENL